MSAGTDDLAVVDLGLDGLADTAGVFLPAPGDLAFERPGGCLRALLVPAGTPERQEHEHGELAG